MARTTCPLRASTASTGNRAPPSRSCFPGSVGPPSRPAIIPWLPSLSPVRVGLSTPFDGVAIVGTRPAWYRRPAWLPLTVPTWPAPPSVPLPPRSTHRTPTHAIGLAAATSSCNSPSHWYPCYRDPAALKNRRKSLHVVPAGLFLPQYSPPHFHLISPPISMTSLRS